MPEIINAFEEEHKDLKVLLSLASTGSLYAQIKNGAPYDVFLSADMEHPKLLSGSGLTYGQPFNYARGALVLWSAKKRNLVEGLFVLSSPRIKRVALPNPRHAPYGVTAKKALIDAGLWEVIQPKLVYGENVGQAAQFVLSGSAQVGFIAESMLRSPIMQEGSFYRLPPGSFDPIIQSGVLIKRKGGRENSLLFKEFLLSERAKEIFSSYGYGLD
jgi:molybdate transport system substrate-binding protein